MPSRQTSNWTAKQNNLLSDQIRLENTENLVEPRRIELLTS